MSEMMIKTLIEPRLQFKRGSTASHPDPRFGLKNFNPLDFNTGRRVVKDTIKIGLICKDNSEQSIIKFLDGLSKNYQADMGGSLTPYTGFEEVYKTKLELPDFSEIVTFSNDEIKNALNLASPMNGIKELYRRAFKELKNNKIDQDVLVVHIPNDFNQYYNYGGTDLRDEIKSIGLEYSIFTQLMKDSYLRTNYPCDFYWNFSLGLYVKAGGIPWKIEQVENFHCYVGISFSVRKSGEKQIILTGIAMIFDEFGEHVGIETIDCSTENKDFFVSKTGFYVSEERFRTILNEVVKIYKTKRGREPEVITVHKTTPFKTEEIGAISGQNEAKVNLVNVQCNTDMRLIPEGSYPPNRGTLWVNGNSSALLYTTGVVELKGRDAAAFKKTYPGIGTAHPLEYRLDFGSLPLEEVGLDILRLTKMNFNSAKLMTREPASIILSRKIGDVLKTGVDVNHLWRDFRYYL